jgi:hypothetical protein
MLFVLVWHDTCPTCIMPSFLAVGRMTLCALFFFRRTTSIAGNAKYEQLLRIALFGVLMTMGRDACAASVNSIYALLRGL